MAKKQLGCGAIVKVDALDDGAFVTVALLKEATPPARSYEITDGTELGSCLTLEEGHREESSDFTFVQHWHPGDTNHEIIDTLFAAGSAGGKREWQIIFPFENIVTDTFEAWVQALTPSTVVVNETIQRTVNLKRTSDITRVTAS